MSEEQKPSGENETVGSELIGGLGVVDRLRRSICNAENDGQLLEDAADLIYKYRKERDQYREFIELVIMRNKLMDPLICLDMLDKYAK